MNLPIPTDNIYKFYAIFGLSLVIASLLGTIQISEKTNNLVYKYAIELDAVEQKRSKENIETFKALINKLVVVAQADRVTSNIFLGLSCGIGVFLVFYGFKRWHTKVQPMHDEILKLQIESLRKEKSK